MALRRKTPKWLFEAWKMLAEVSVSNGRSNLSRGADEKGDALGSNAAMEGEEECCNMDGIPRWIRQSMSGF